MPNLLFPKQIDNAFRGYRSAIAIFALIVTIKGIQGFVSMFDTYNVATGADGIALEQFNPAGVQAVLGMFVLLGMYVVVLPLQSLVVLIRWRALIPFMYLTLIAVQIGARVITTLNPIPRAIHEGAPSFAGYPVGFWVNIALISLTILGFILSLIPRGEKA